MEEQKCINVHPEKAHCERYDYLEVLCKRAEDMGGITSTLSFALGGAIGRGLYKDYPSGFNREIWSVAQAISNYLTERRQDV